MGFTRTAIRAYAIADNRLAELAGWDKELLAAELEFLCELDFEFPIEITGFEMAEIDILISSASDSTPEEDCVNELPEAHPEPFTRSGDLWLMDRHKLFCGDATKSDSFDTLMQRRAQAMRRRAMTGGACSRSYRGCWILSIFGRRASTSGANWSVSTSVC